MLEGDQRALLHLLSQGVTVSAAAAAIHVSVRTAHRRLAQARVELGVGTTGEAILALSQDRAGAGRPLGREAEVASALGALARGDSVVVVGPAGIGKTALLDAVVEATRRDARRGAGLPSRRWESFRPLLDAIDRLPADGDAVAVAERLTAALGEDLLAIDDLHWADAGTIEVLERVGRQRAIVAASRPDGPGDDTIGRLHQAGWEVVAVPPLTRTAAEALLGERRRDLAKADLDPILEAAAGNPLLLLSIGGGDDVRNLEGSVRSQLQEASDGAQQAMALVGVAERPLSLTQLPTGALELVALGLADLVGNDLWPRHHLHAAVAAELLTERELADARHHLATVLPAGEAARHLAAAGDDLAAFERAREAAASASTPRERAAHLTLAAGCAQGDVAARLRLEALDATLSSGDIGRAAEQLAALEAVPSIPESERALRRAQVLWLSADPEGARQAVAAGLAQERGARTPAEVRLRIEELRFPIRVDWDAPLAVALGTEAVALADEVGIERARTRALLASAHLISGTDDGTLLEDALAIARADGDLDAELEVGHSLTTRLMLGPTTDARQLALELEARADDAHRGHWRMQFRFHRLLVDLLRDPDREVLSEVADVLATRSPEARAWIEGIAPYAVAIAHLGRIGEARRLVTETLQAGLGDDTSRCVLLWATAEIELADGCPAAALDAVHECLRSGPDGFFIKTIARLVQGWTELEMGRPVTIGVLPPTFPVFGRVPEEAEALQLLDSSPQAAMDAFDALAHSYTGVSTRAALRCRWAQGEAARRAGRRDDAVESWRSAATVAADRGFVAAERLARASLRSLGDSGRAPSGPAVGRLTRREDQVLRHVADGATSADIARRLGVTTATVESTITSAMRKVGAGTRRQAVAVHLGPGATASPRP